MRRLGRRRRDRGAAALIVVALFAGGVILGCAALTVDVGQWMVERRSLQNGADAGALSLAKTCATTPVSCSWSGASTGLIALNNANAGADSVSDFNTSVAYPNGVCQKNLVASTQMPLCTVPDSPDCLPLPTWITSTTKYVEVHTKTKTTTGSKIPPVFGGAVGETDGGKTLGACARVALLPVSGGTVVPLTFSLCEWNNFAATPDKIVPSPPYTSPPYPSPGWPSSPLTYGAGPSNYEHTIYLHDTSGSAHCNAGPSGADLPGGFGWLDPATGLGCHTALTGDSYVSTSTGNSVPNVCDLSTLRNSEVLIPIYDTLTGTGNNITYHIKFFASFYITGYWAPGAANRVPSSATGTTCANSQTCLFGWFTSGLIPAAQVNYTPGANVGGVVTPVVAG